jgi:hypothetical protein
MMPNHSIGVGHSPRIGIANSAVIEGHSGPNAEPLDAPSKLTAGPYSSNEMSAVGGLTDKLDTSVGELRLGFEGGVSAYVGSRTIFPALPEAASAKAAPKSSSGKRCVRILAKAAPCARSSRST